VRCLAAFIKLITVCLAIPVHALEVNSTHDQQVIQSIRISALGDVLVHKPLYEIAVRRSDGFYSIIKPVRSAIESSDIAYANLEGATATGITEQGRDQGDIGFVYDGIVYSGTNFKFNYHPSLINDLQRLGINVVSTANNHALDRGSIGVDRTIEALQERGMLFAGTKHTQRETSPIAITEAQGIRVGWLACTESLNGHRDPNNQVQLCNSRFFNTDFAAIKTQNNIDILIVTPHWGKEYHQEASSSQKANAQKAIENGVDAIIGAHPHVVQPWEVITTSSGRKGFVIYSLGNFVACQAPLPNRTSLALHLTVNRLSNNEVVISQADYTPVYRPRGSSQILTFNPSDTLNSDQREALRLLQRLLPN
jgi:hypothetical protein